MICWTGWPGPDNELVSLSSLASPSRRVVLALVRLVFLYIALCYVLLEIGFAWRTLSEARPFFDQSHAAGPQTAYPAQQAGVNVALEQYAESDQRQAALQKLRAADFGWVRQRVDWRLLQPTAGHYEWTQMDQILADVGESGLEFVAVLDGSPAWARAEEDLSPTDNPFAPPRDYADFAGFGAAFARRYGEKVDFYQIWDEPNIAPHWGNRWVEPVAYARMLAAVAPAIRSADTDAVILLAALAPTVDRGHTAIDEAYYLQRLYAAGAAPYFDAAAAQPFGFGLSPDDPRSRVEILNFRRVGLLRRVMMAEGDGETPIWAVRYGWSRLPNSLWQSVTPENQARYVAQVAGLAQGWPWLAGLGWANDRPAAPQDDPQWGFALYTPDGLPLPLWETFAQINSSPRVLPQPGPLPLFARLLFWLLALLFVLWRASRAGHIAGIAGWPARWTSLPPWAKGTGWLLLAAVYYFATWPPLIGLCWLVASLFLAAEPLTGLILGGLLLPFHYQHKEMALVGAVLTVPPAYALLLCTLPGRIGAALRRYSSPDRADSFPSASLRFHQWLACAAWQRLSSTDRLAAGWLLVSLLSAGAADRWRGIPEGLWWLGLGPLLFYTLGRALATTPAAKRRVMSGLGAGGILAALAGLFLWWMGEGTTADGVRRLVGMTFSPNQTALLLVRLLFVSLGLALAERRWIRWLWLAGAGMLGVALLLTGSRGAWLLGVPAGVTVLLLLHPALRGRFLRRPWLFAAILVLLLIGGAFLLGGRLLNSTTVSQRLQIWQASLEMWRAFPWLGIGPGGFFWHYPAFLMPGAIDEPNLLHPHNLWLEFATGWGLFGLLWCIGFFYWLAQRIRRDGRLLDGVAVGLLAGLIAGLAHAQVDAFGALPELAAWNWLAIGLLSSGD